MNSRMVRFVVGLLGAGTVSVASLGVVFLLRSIDRVQPQTNVSITDTTSVCFEELQKVDSSPLAFVMGNEYFGGKRGYDLACARIAYDRAIALDPKGHVALWYQLGRIDFIEGRFDDALFKFDKQEEFFEGEIPSVHYARGLTYGYRARRDGASEDWGRAEDSFRHFIDLYPSNVWAHVDLSWVFFSQGKYDEMKPLLEEMLREEPQHPWLLNMYGLALLNTGKYTDAAQSFEAGLATARQFTPEQWGAAYPGNNPELWSEGLAEMIRSMEKNLELARSGK